MIQDGVNKNRPSIHIEFDDDNDASEALHGVVHKLEYYYIITMSTTTSILVIARRAKMKQTEE